MIKQTKQQARSIVLNHQRIGNQIWKLRLHNPLIAQHAKSGQFVQILVPNHGELDPILRRPISISLADAEAGWFEVIFREVGRGTKMLAQIMEGEILNVMGPLGKGFSLRGERPLLIGGGMGVAPLIYQAAVLCPKPTLVAIGGRNEEEVFWSRFFEGVCDEVKIATDDGSCGVRGNALCLLEGLEKEVDYVYTCGPEGLLKAVAAWAASHNIPCEVSLEKHMACGVGVCLACTCDTTAGRRKVCMNGPVFPAEEVYPHE